MEVRNVIRVPKNNFRIFTVDKDGNETGKSVDSTNTWTYSGLREFWLRRVDTGGSANYATDLGGSDTGFVHIIISESGEEINKEFTTFDSQYRTWGSSTRVNVRDGVNYDAASIVNVNGNEYLQLRHLRRWEFGELEASIQSVAIATSANISSTILAGKTLEIPFEVTEEEQLLVRYDILIPMEYVSTSPASSTRNVFGELDIVVNGSEHTAKFAKNYFYHTGNIETSSRITISGHTGVASNNGRWMVNNTDHINQPYTLTGGDGWMEYSVDIQVNPYPMGGVNINSLGQMWTNSTGSSANYLLQVFFEPPIPKGEDERVFISFTVRQEVEEYEL